MFKRLIFVTLVIVVLACGGSQTPQAVGPNNTEQPAEPKSYAIGEMVAIGDIRLTVNGVEDVTEPEMLKPKDGNRFILVDVTFENVGSDSTNVSTALQMKVKDDTGQQYTINISASSYGISTPDGEIAPGEKLRGQAGYEIPIEAGGLQFVYDASLFGKGKVIVDLE